MKIWRIGAQVTAVASVAIASGIAHAEPTYSADKKFRDMADVAQSRLNSGDVTGAAGYIAALAPDTPFEKYLTASMAFELAVKKNDIVAQRSAIATLLQSGGVPESELGRLNFIAGYLSYQTGAIDNAIVYLTRAREQKLADPKASLMLAECYIRQRKLDMASQLLGETINTQRQAGQPVPAAWYDRAASVAQQRKDWAAVSYYGSAKLGGLKPANAAEWRTGLVSFLSGARLDKEAELDLYRLQAATGALASERDYQGYATLAAGQGYPAEARAIIETGQSSGKLSTNDSMTSALMRSLRSKAVVHLASIKGLPGKAPSVNNAVKAAQDGDNLLANSQFADAVPYYRAALDKGGVDKDRVFTRLGIALARSGDMSGAEQALAQAKGGWGQVAAYWLAWVNARGDGAAKAAASNGTASSEPST